MALGISEARVPRDYDMRSSDAEGVHGNLLACGLLRIAPESAEAGDLLLVRSGPAQLHLVLVTDLGYLHADARLRRVVEAPGPVPWPVLSAWRAPSEAPPGRPD